MATFIAFWLLFVLTLDDRERRARVRGKSASDWVLDGAGLLVQGALIPLLQLFVFALLYRRIAPQYEGTLVIPPIAAFLFNFVVVDYLYYWNHRLLHSRALWNVHLVHHTVTEMDVLGTSRNTLWSSFVILYVWVNSALLFTVSEPAAYAAGAAATACLDLWRHSAVQPAQASAFDRILRTVLITPRDHARHHGDDEHDVNFGANFNLWDRLHGTFRPGADRQGALGVKSDLGLARMLLWPFSRRAPDDGMGTV